MRERRSIASIILVAFLFVTCIPITVVCSYTYQYLSQNIRKDFHNRSKQYIAGVDSNLNIYFNEIKKITDSVFTSETIRSLLLAEAGTQAEQFEQDRRFREYFLNLVGSRADFSCITLYKENGDFLEWNLRQVNRPWPDNQQVLRVLEENGAKLTLFGPRKQIGGSGYQNYFTVGRQIKHIDTGKNIGYIIIDLDYAMFGKMIGMSEKQKENLLIVDKADQVVYNSHNRLEVLKIYHNIEDYMEKQEQSEEKQFVEVTGKSFDWRYYMISDKESLLKELNLVALTFLTVGSLCFLAFFIVAFCISRSISRPLNRLERAMSNAENSGFNEVVPAFDTYGEVNRLTRRYNVMLVEIQRLIENEKELSKKKAESDYQALQLQITPHFLYNSLDSINCLAQVYGKNDISEMILSLADIFKYNMRYETKTVILSDEINHVKNYCMLQAVHFQDRFEIQYEIEENCQQREVTKFMLQPLVENAINYGVSKKKAGGVILIKAEEKEDKLLVSVRDNGAGMSEETRAVLQKMMRAEAEELLSEPYAEYHIGLYNVNLRLKLQYGNEAGMMLDSVRDRQTIVTIYIPFGGKEYV